jgi:hypothetical protein
MPGRIPVIPLMAAAAVAAALLALGCVLAATPPTSEPEAEAPQYQDAAYEVVVYDSPNHGGRSEKYALEENQRQNLVPFVGWGLNDRISSIRVGYRAGVILFYHKDFGGRAKIFYDTTMQLEQDFNDEASSLIIFDRELGEPMGLLLGQGPVSENNLLQGIYPEASRFYPLPQELQDSEARIKFVEDFNDQAEWAFLAGGVQGRYQESSIEAILFEHDDFRGNSLSLPPSARDRRSFFLLEEYGFNRMTSSLIVLERSAGRR